MNKDLQDQFFCAMMRIKKMGAMFSSECEIQMNELAILQTAAGECDCSGCAGVNLNVPMLQEQLHITKPAISYILNTLEKKNYIVRTIDSRDRRKISIAVTPEGKAAAEQSEQKYDAMWQLLLERFGEDDMHKMIELLYRATDICEELQCEENQKK